ncbi:hypothetical protein [uncultured Parvimonas sp.]|jgi:hypothetical protein|uniref:hypothetical protein n=1 Tax=uncultured Parvimonas sp. TaxID=747372 RepID=UPI00325FD95C
MRILLFSFLGSSLGTLTVFICLNYLKKNKKIFSNKILDFKVTDETKIGVAKVELDKIIDGFIKESRKTFDYSENKLLQKLCIDLFHLKVVLIDEEKEEILRDIILNEYSEYNIDNEIPYFTKLINKYIDRIEEYRKEQLEKDFNKIKNR